MIITKFGETLESLISKKEIELNMKFVIQLGIQILKNLEHIHEAGFVYNDIRLRNIIIDEDSVKLIDYGNSLEYLDHNGVHILNIN